MKMKIVKYLGIIILILSCSPSSKMYISNINNIGEIDNNSMIYSLPRTVVRLSVTAVKTEFIPGPYAEFADKYMGIKNVVEKPVVKWAITNLSLDSYTETDPDNYFTVSFENDPGSFIAMLDSFANSGLILTPFHLKSNQPIYSSIGMDEDFSFEGLSIKKNLDSEKQTSYKRVLKDSVYIQVPVESNRSTIKSPEVKAEETANFIIKLRKRKFKLLTGQNDSTPADGGMSSAIEELNKTEEAYLSLFIGKEIQAEYTKTFEYIPLVNKENEQPILFKISESEGILQPVASQGKPVFLEIVNTNNTKIFEKFPLSGNVTEIENTILYRLPEIVKVLVKEDDKILLEGKIKVFQKGAFVAMNLPKK